ncbi:MAG: glycosyltransferase family 2 protein [Candidatus Omnitrophota bacterium]
MRRCDIIMVTWNQLEYTKLCVESILKNTDVSARLIIVDNGSDPDTVAYLRSVRPAGNVVIVTIFNTNNIGAIKARNQGIRLLDADYLCFVDNDIEVTKGWLSRMIALADRYSDIGVVNPSSNNYDEVPPGDVTLEEYAAKLAARRGEYIEVGQGISFCMLVKREVVDKIGLMDEDLDTMFYEDTDYSMRSNAEGYRCVIAKDVYVWHHGHRTSRNLKKYETIYHKNRTIFQRKFGRALRVAWFAPQDAADPAFKEVLVTAIELAREGDFIYIYYRGQKEMAREEIFRAHGFVEHANVHLKICQSASLAWFALWRVLVRRKKPYGIAVTTDHATARLLKGFALLHGARVIEGDDFDEIHEIAHAKKFEGI